MSQMMVSARSENKGIALNCPHCSFTCRHDVSHVEDCIKLHEPLVCVACGSEFTVETVSLTRVAEQRDEAVTSIRGANELQPMYECGNCGVPRFIHGVILEACPQCGDDETDLSQIDDVP